MLPSHFVPVEAIPLTASGKKDRRALLSKHRDKILRRTEYVAPRSGTERNLAAIWKAALAIDCDIGVYDDFTTLGGDSLRSLLIIEELELQIGMPVPPGHFGRFTTIARMAVQIEELGDQRKPAAPTHCNSA